ncbi:MAG: SET domain-containing protein [Leptospirales bacterium]|nr:SET domain-containing protein [Leptospirales bacterium]
MATHSGAAAANAHTVYPNFTDDALVYTRETKIGRGLFARVDLPAGKMLGALSAGVTTALDIKSDGSVDYPPCTVGQCIDLIIRDNKLVTILKPADVYYDGVDMINHNCEPNCTITETLVVVTLREIRADEELTCDYLKTGITKLREGIHCQCRPGCQTIL